MSRVPAEKGIGETAPDLDLTDVWTGETLALADFRGRDVLLNVWATWCGPCRREMPALDSLQRERPETLVVIHASSEDINTIIDWTVDVPTGNRHTRVEREDLRGAYAAAYSIKPVTFVIGRDGTLRARLVGAETLQGFREALGG
ncbi:TlpA family protein disulfide reductase [Rubricoccus marinus]|nr:TlpA disulfide reductase family protein [Rubricoccus marinus]